MKCKKTIDYRSYSHEALEKVRKDAVKRVESGESPEDVAIGLGLNRRTIYKWLSTYHYGGEEALNGKAVPGAPRKFDDKKLSKLARIVQDNNPQQYKFEYALWTLAMIRTLIDKEFKIKLSEVSVGRLMKRIGFSAQRPLYRAWQQDPKAVDLWTRETYPQLVKRAKRVGGLIFFADESGIRSDHHAGTTWSKRGKTPIVKATGARYGVNMISAVNALGHFRFMVVEGSVNATVFLEFLKRLVQGMDRKIFLIVDGHPTHKAKLVSNWVNGHLDQIELHFLPSYSPELNPDELAWGHLKNRIGKTVAQSKDELLRAVNYALRSLQKLPAIVSAFFSHPECQYANT